MSSLTYSPPPILKTFIKDYRQGELFYDWCVGPVGSGKTTALFFKLVHLASLQAPQADGIRRTKAVIVRNSAPQLKDTTIASWNYWFRDGQAGTWKATEKTFVLRFGDVECEVLFRPLDTPDDVARVLSLEVTFAIIDEFVQIPKEIVEALSGRCGRYPSKKDGGATNWGMWGASNPSTEDNWWYDYLHKDLPANARYYKQPGGLAPDAENIENLPGGLKYYESLIIGKSPTWIKQFVDSEWGFSAAGKPVIPTFNATLHTPPTSAPTSSTSRAFQSSSLKFNPHLKLVVGFDPGIAGTAAIFGQEDLYGRLLVMGEIVEQGFGVERLIKERLAPYISNRFPGADVIIAPDPAAANRSQTNERSVVDVLKRYFKVSIETNNRLPMRLNAIEHYTTRLVMVDPTLTTGALLVDPEHCPILLRALKGGWRYALDTKNDVIKGVDPEKNAYSHPGDAFGYLARYFHKQNEKLARYGGTTHMRFTPQQNSGSNAYHMR